MELILALILLFLSHVIRTFIGLNARTYPMNRIPVLNNSIVQLIALPIWIGLLIWAGNILYSFGIVYLFIGVLLYLFVFNFFFLKHFRRYFGGDLVFPDSLKYCKGIIQVMVQSYLLRKKAIQNIDENELLLKTFKSRYHFMNDRKRKAIVDKCSDIKELIYEVLKIDFIDFDVRKSKPIKEQVDEMINEYLQQYS